MINSKNNTTNTRASQALDLFLILTFLITAFFVLTNGIPLFQEGWVHAFPKKANYRLFVLIFGLILLVLKLKYPVALQNTWIARQISSFSNLQMKSAGILLYGLYAAIYTFIGFARHAALETRAFDLGIFSQAVWNTVHGHFLLSSLRANICLLGDHFSPILVLTVPFYALWQDPRMLLILQSLAAGAFIFPLMYFAYQKTNDRWIAFLFAVIFFFYLPTRSALREDFHPEILIEPLIFWAFLAVEELRWKRFAFFAVLILAAKENMCGVVFILGFYAAVFKKKFGPGLAWMIIAVSTFLLETKVLIPAINPAGYFYTLNFGTPFELLSHAVSFESLKYVLTVFGPFLFLPFLSPPTLMLTGPIFFQNILSSNILMRSMKYHYLAGMTAFLFIATLAGLGTLLSKHAWFQRNARLFTAVVLIVSLLRSGPSEYYTFWNIKNNETRHIREVRQKLQSIGSSYSVASHNNIIAQIPNRLFLYKFEPGENPSKVELVRQHAVDYVILEKQFWEGTKSYEEALAGILALGYVTEYEKEGFVMLRKKAL